MGALRQFSAGAPPTTLCPGAGFARTSCWTAVNESGFSVRIEDSSGVSYEDADGRVFLDAEGRVFLESEWLADGVRVHLDSSRSHGLGKATPARVDEVLRRIIRGLRFLGYQCEVVGRVRSRERWRWMWRY